MAITSSGSFVATNNKIAGTSFSFTTTGRIDSGSLGVLLMAADNLGTAQNSTQFSEVSDNVIFYNFLQGTGFDSTAKTIISQSDGKILVGGDFSSYNDSNAPFIVRLNSDGSIDSTFQNCLDGSINQNVCKLAIQTGVTGSYFSGTGVWSTGGSLITGRFSNSAAGTQNSALTFGGLQPTSVGYSCTEEYNGTSWSSGGALITARGNSAGLGLQNSALNVGGEIESPITCYSCTEEYNGTSWSAGGALITARDSLGGAGYQNSATVFGGGVSLTCTEEYNGTSWAVDCSMINGRTALGGNGTSKSSLASGGFTSPTQVSCTEEYNGSTWSAGGNLITARYSLAGFGAQNSGVVAGGIVGPSTFCACTEQYNGSTWSVAGSLITARGSLGGTGIQNFGLVIGGRIPTAVSSTEEYNVTSTVTCTSDKIVAVGPFGVVRLNNDGSTDPSLAVGSGFDNTVCTVLVEDTTSYIAGWSVVSPIITARYWVAGAGTQNSALGFGGFAPGVTNATEEFDGVGWISGGNLITARATIGGAGTQNEGLAIGGFTNTNVSCTEEYNGSTWSAGGVLINARFQLGGAGTQNLGLAIGGQQPGVNVACTEEYNGLTWIACGALITARSALGGSGTQNSGLGFGGATTVVVACTEEYNGTTWSTGGALITARFEIAGVGTQNATIAFGGNLNPGDATCTELYNGTSWSVGCSMVIARATMGGAGTQDAAIAFGGLVNRSTNSRCAEVYNSTTYTNKIIVGGLFTSYNGSTCSGSVKIKGDGGTDSSFNIGTGFSGTTDVRDLKFYNSLGVWSVGGSLITARTNLGGAGTQNLGLAIGGSGGIGDTTCTEEYNGATWSSGGSLITARYNLSGVGTQNEALGIGGFRTNPATSTLSCTEEYNGTSWSAGGALINSRYNAGASGTQNSGVVFGGSQFPVNISCTEEYNGISWSAGNALNTANLTTSANSGTQNAALSIGFSSNEVESYDGTSWSTEECYITRQTLVTGTGTQNAALLFGGSFSPSGTQNCTQQYNGVSWIQSGAMINGSCYAGGAGTQLCALSMGGYSTPGSCSCTEEYSSNNYLLAAGNFVSYSGNSRNRLALIDITNGTVAPTSSFNIGTGFSSTVNSVTIDSNNQLVAVGNFTGFGGTAFNRITKLDLSGGIDQTFNQGTGINNEACVICDYGPLTSGVWSVGGAMITARYSLAGAGSGLENTFVAFGGGVLPATVYTCTEEYNGATWASAPNVLPTGRMYLMSTGTQNYALAVGGQAPGSPLSVSCTEEFNGNSFLTGGSLINVKSRGAAVGIVNSAVVFGGAAPLSCTEEYNGTNWSAGGTIITSRSFLSGAGTQNAALGMGGSTGPTIVSCTEEYNGVSWSSGGALISVRYTAGSAGTQNEAIIFGGSSVSVACCSSEKYDGTSWSSSSNLITTISETGGAGSQNNALSFGGFVSPAAATCTQEYSQGNLYIVGGTFGTYNGVTASGSTVISYVGNFYRSNPFSATTDVEDFLIDTTTDSVIAVGSFTFYSSSYTPNPNRIVKITSGGTVDASSTTGSTWVKLQEYSDGSAAGAGSTVAMYYTTPSTTIPSGTTITVKFSGGSVTAKAVSGWAFNGTNITGFTGTTTATQLQPGSLTVSGSTSSSSGEHLYVRGTSFENTTLTFTPTTNFSAFTQSATSGGSAVTNQGIVGEFRILTATSATSNPTLSTNTSNASVMYSFYEVTTAGGRTYFIVIN